MILDRLEAATAPDDAVSVSANWRITFAWQDLDAVDVDFEDYH
jgi:plasmid maintenance system killer protein